MTKVVLKLGYSPAAFRARAEIDVDALVAAPAYPQDSLEKLQKKFTSVQAEAAIEGFVIYEELLKSVWNQLQDPAAPVKASQMAGSKLSFTIGVGFPALKGVSLRPVNDRGILFNLTIDAPKSLVQKWHLDWLKALITKRLERYRITTRPHWPQVEAAFHSAKRGTRIDTLPIQMADVQDPTNLGPSNASGGPEEKKTSPIRVIAHKQRSQVYLMLSRPEVLANISMLDKHIHQLEGMVSKIPVDSGMQVRVLKAQLNEALKAAASGPERIGVQLPLILLAALPVPKGAPSAGISEESETNQPEQGQGNIVLAGGKLVIRVTKKGMQASITYFDTSIYQTQELDIEWFHQQLSSAGIHLATAKGSEKSITESLARKKDLNGLVVAQGKQAYGATEPYLHPSFRDTGKAPSKKSKKDLAEGETSVRDAQQKTIVKKGQLIAEIKYKKPEIIGRDIFGKQIKPVRPERFRVNHSDDVECRKDRFFYAKCDGVPKVTRNNVSVNRTYVHTGDVNLMTGNIYFDGPVRILGSIDKGAVVQVDGNLEVAGSVRSDQVRCMGKLTVQEGIVTGSTKGSVYAEEQILTDFIENSRVECGGDIKVKKAIINSVVFCKGPVNIKDQSGVIAGGTVSSYFNIETGFIGFKSGNRTKIEAGVDWKARRKVEKSESRLAMVEKWQATDRAQLREILGRPPNQLTKRHHDLKDTYQKKLQKASALIAKLKERVQAARSALSFNRNTIVVVRESIYSSVDPRVAGKLIPIPREIASVFLTKKKRRGSNVHPLDQLRRSEFEGEDITGLDDDLDQAG